MYTVYIYNDGRVERIYHGLSWGEADHIMVKAANYGMTVDWHREGAWTL